MKIGIHNQPAGEAIGGTEQCTAVLASALRQEHDVEIVHHQPALTAARLAEYCGVDLGGVRMRYEPVGPTPERSWNFVKHRRAVVDSNKAYSAPYDIFVNFTHDVPPFCHAPKGVLAVLFPYHNEAARARRGGGGVLRGLERAYSRRLWQARFATYQEKTAISEYSRLWTERFWGLECTVLPPPVDTNFASVQKQPQILSVGRFDTSAHPKKQQEMAQTFAELSATDTLPGWEYYCMGGLSQNPDDAALFARVQQAVSASPAHVVANAPRAELKQRYAHASLFWHAAGLGEDNTLAPWQAEHFGITTVEAMAAGCVPLVINKGGQPEIVEHEKSGFVWETLDELKRYTCLLAADAPRREAMAQAARARAAFYSREQFVRRFRHVLFDTPL